MDVEQIWTRLAAIREMRFQARSFATRTTGWSGAGVGEVRTELKSVTELLFHEQGTWTPENGRPSSFRNTFRWLLQPDDPPRFRLEHLRFGPDQPVYLFDLVPSESGGLVSSTPHVCRDDRYSARLDLDEMVIRLNWTVDGPKKREQIDYTYQ